MYITDTAIVTPRNHSEHVHWPLFAGEWKKDNPSIPFHVWANRPPLTSVPAF